MSELEQSVTGTVEASPPLVLEQALPHKQHIVYPTILDTGRSLLSIIVIALFVLTFIVQPFRIPSESMEHTLLVGDFLLVNKMIYASAGIWRWLLPYRQIQHGDVVVFHFPPDPLEHVVKRVIGVPGDHIHLRNGQVFLNGQPLNEPYALYEVSYIDPFRDQFPVMQFDPGIDAKWWTEMRGDMQNGDLIVPKGRYFVLGDNRNHSRDSRYWGFVPQPNIVGRPFLIYFSLRQSSVTAVPDLPGDRLRHDNTAVNSVIGFARWDRMFRVVW